VTKKEKENFLRMELNLEENKVTNYDINMIVLHMAKHRKGIVLTLW